MRRRDDEGPPERLAADLGDRVDPLSPSRGRRDHRVLAHAGGRPIVPGTKTYRYYRCGAFLNEKACSNHRSLPLDAAHAAVAGHLRREALTPARLDRVLDDLAAEQAARPAERTAERQALTAALAAVDGKLARLIAAIEDGGELRALTVRMKDLERERAALAAQVEHLDGLEQAAALEGQARSQAEQILAGWAEALAAGPLVARQALRKIVRGPIVVRPEEDGSWSYEAPCSMGAVLGGVIGREPEIWKVTVGTPPAADLDEELRALLSRRSVSRS